MPGPQSDMVSRVNVGRVSRFSLVSVSSVSGVSKDSVSRAVDLVCHFAWSTEW